MTRNQPPTSDKVIDHMKDIFNAEKRPCSRTTWELFNRYANETNGGFRNWLKLYKRAEREMK